MSIIMKKRTVSFETDFILKFRTFFYEPFDDNIDGKKYVWFYPIE